MKCYYEILDVARDASDADIKVAYRKLALKWHPDKNLDNSDLAKEQFQMVQQAYDVLSDRQERAWYDNHREQILRGSGSEFEDKSLDVFQYFNTACFKGYDDDENGFYTVYRNVFENIAKEDMEFIEEKEEFCQIPSFGNSNTDFENVSAFYNYWLNYSTKKSYVWLDPYDIAGVKDRRYVKAVEKENKKVRLKAKKERNEEVRNLVIFVKKRDKRVQAQKKIQEQKTLESKKKRELLTKQKRLERQQELNKSCDEPEWSKFDNFKSELEEIEKHTAEQFGEEFTRSEDEEEEDFSNLYCVACNKIFKTIKAFENHELSKKHKENVALLKEIMLNEEALDGEEECNDNEEKHGSGIEDIVEELDEELESKRKKKKKPRNVLSVDVEESSFNGDDDDISGKQVSNEEVDFTQNKKSKRKPKKNKNKSDGDEKKNNVKKSKKDKRRDGEHNLLNVDMDHTCVTCKSNFPSKNKLFDHLKKTNHGVYISVDVRKKRDVK
ncbi:hypothetical protein NQ315_009798 [Exocentrus adspersus]|uniref:DnaJ homolog subfamily C member 21 n=1 Tax=Exocentrus adspersus TaxID=1586481 RepID=A0AAV8WJK7_9CUCU|nr:hypothetical protein NQ315_009798 [Exocentrus adspersus]